MSGFNYTFIIQEDASSGYKDEKTKKWSGMIGEVINGVSVFDKMKNKIDKNIEIDLIIYAVYKFVFSSVLS